MAKVNFIAGVFLSLGKAEGQAEGEAHCQNTWEKHRGKLSVKAEYPYEPM